MGVHEFMRFRQEMLLGRACSLGVMPRDRVIDRLAHRFELEWSTGAVSVSDRFAQHPHPACRPPSPASGRRGKLVKPCKEFPRNCTSSKSFARMRLSWRFASAEARHAK